MGLLTYLTFNYQKIVDSVLGTDLDKLIDTSSSFLESSVWSVMLIVLGIYTMVVNHIDAVPIAWECVPMLVEEVEADSFVSLLFFDNFYDQFTSNMSTLARETMEINMNRVHMVVSHGEYQEFILFTINSDYTINVLANEKLNSQHPVSELNYIDEQFDIAMNELILEKGSIDLKIIIITFPSIELLKIDIPFIPLKEYIATHPCRLFVYTAINSDTMFYLGHIPTANNCYTYIENLSTQFYNLERSISYASRLCGNIYNFYLGNRNEVDWSEVALGWGIGLNQQIRYMEMIYDIFGSIQPIDTVASRALGS